MLLAMQAYLFFGLKTVSICLLIFTFISARVLDRNYIAYCCILSIQFRQERLAPEDVSLQSIDRFRSNFGQGQGAPARNFY